MTTSPSPDRPVGPSWTPSELDARFGALVRASTQAIFQMSPDWSEMCFLSGGGFLADTDEPRVDWREDYVHEPDRELVDAAIADAIRAKGIFELEHRVMRADGSVGWTASRAVPILGDDGEICEWFGAASDVTDEKLAEGARDARAQREHEFAANAAHQLRTPVTAIMASVEVLELPTLSGEQRVRTFEHLRREAARLSRLYDSLLLLAELDAIATGPDAELEIAPLLHDAAAHLEPADGVAVVIDVPPGLEFVVNQGLVELILDNIAGNAAKYTTGGRIVLRAALDAGHLLIEVQDSGPGFSSDFYDDSPARFFQASSTAGGFGLGLAIAHQAAAALGARLSFGPAQDGGTVASLDVPAVRP